MIRNLLYGSLAALALMFSGMASAATFVVYTVCNVPKAIQVIDGDVFYMFLAKQGDFQNILDALPAIKQTEIVYEIELEDACTNT